MTAYIHHLRYDFINGLRDRSLLLMNYLFPLVLFVMMGALLGGINPTFHETIIPAMISIAVMTSTLLGMPNPIVAGREAGVFRSFKINGVPASSLLSIPALSSLFHMILVSAIITALAVPLFKANLPLNWGYFILVGLLSIFAMSGLGMLIGVISTNSRATILISQIFFVPSMMLSGMVMPMSALPPSMQPVAMLLPATHAMNAWRSLAFGQPTTINPVWNLVILFAGGLLGFGLAVTLFQWDSHNQQRGHSPFLAVIAMTPFLLAAVLLQQSL
jgi:ABC-2 type transport system permease protein